MIKNYFNIGTRRWIGLILGNILIGLGVCIFKISGMGNDPFSAMVISVSSLLHLSFSTYLILLNAGLFLVEIALGRKFIGIGTFANWFLVGYVVEFFLWLTNAFITPPETFILRLPYTLVGVIIISLGVSLYQTSNAGIAPYDSIALILDERISVLPYFWCRIILDGISAIICLLTGGLIGLGTFLCAFCLGPIIHFFNIGISKKFIYKNAKN